MLSYVCSKRTRLRRKEMTLLEYLSCGHKFPRNEIELTNVNITDEYFRINKLELFKMQYRMIDNIHQ